MTFSDHFKVIIINLKMVEHATILTMADQQKVYQTAPMSMSLNDPYPQFQGHAIL